MVSPISNPYIAEILSASVSFVPRSFLKPLLLSSGPITEITEAQAEVRVRVQGREAAGRGSIYLSDLWGWPDPLLAHSVRDAAMRKACETFAAGLSDLCGGEAHHPLELGMRLHQTVIEPSFSNDPEIARMPPLARGICLSPFDAAIHDAVGQALEISAFRFYDAHAELPSADAWFPERGAVASIAEAIQPPESALTAWLIVGAAGSPEEQMADWIRDRGYHGFKVKLIATDNKSDVAHTIAVYRAARKLGLDRPRLCVDSNCANPDAESVLDYLERLRAEDAETFAALEYVEQPTGRDITTYRYDWRPVTALKPVLLDEGLTGPEQMEIAEQQGWSGFAIKTCKGHSFAVLAAAWAREHGMLAALQDLTNPGYSAIHAFLYASRLRMINGLELNSPQYTPDANAGWLPRLKPLFEPSDGFHRLPGPPPAGLGSAL